MKKTVLILFICSLVFARDFYVSPEGRDDAGGNGSKDRPVASVARAVERAAKFIELRGCPEEGIVINVDAGVYRIDETIKIDKTLSGSENGQIVIKAADGGKVEIIGGPKFTLSEFSPVTDPEIEKRLHPAAKGKAVVLDLKKRGITEYGQLPLYGHSMYCLNAKTRYKSGGQAPELFFNAKPLTIARWPNEGFAKTGSVVEKGDIIRDWMDDRKGQDAYVAPEQRNDPPKGIAFKMDKERLERWKNAEDIWLYGYWFNNWSDQTLQVAGIDAQEGIIRSVQPSGYGVKKDQRFYAFNLLEEMDEPGEWYLDRSKGKLYLIPPENDPDAELHLSLLKDKFMAIDGVSNLLIEGIDFGYTRGSGIDIDNSSSVKLLDCKVANTGSYGIRIQGGKNNSVVRCEVFNNGSGGITVNGGNVNTLTPAGHFVENCLIYDYARIEKTYKPAINLSGVGNRASHNEIHSGAHMAVGFSGNNHIIEYNHIYDVARETDDMSAIYSGRSWYSRGTVIRYNLLRNITGYKAGTHRVSGVYLDDGISGITVEGNIFLNVAQGLMFNGGRDNTAVNNVFIDVENMARSTSLKEAFKGWAASSWTTLNENIRKMPIKEEPWRSAYPNLANMLEDEPELPKYTTIKNNLRYNSPIIISKEGIHEVVTEYGDVRNNLEIDKKPGSYDPQSGHFKFDPSSGVFDIMGDLKNIPTEKIGRIK